MATKLIGNLAKGLLFVLSAPAGTGKTTLMERLKREFPCIVASPSYTTRKQRANEIDGVDYHFITEEQFKQKIVTNDFLEYAKVYDNYYGTDKKWVETKLNEGKHVFLVIDTQGEKQLHGKKEIISIFLRPPSLEELERRLRHRNTETDSVLNQRLQWAKKEMEAMHNYHYQIINDDLEIAYQTLKSIVVAEEHRVKNLITS